MKKNNKCNDQARYILFFLRQKLLIFFGFICYLLENVILFITTSIIYFYSFVFAFINAMYIIFIDNFVKILQIGQDPKLIVATGDGNCLFNSLALSFASALGSMKDEEFSRYKLHLNNKDNPVFKDLNKYFLNTPYRTYSLEKWREWFSSKNIYCYSDRICVERIWSYVIRNLSVDYARSDLMLKYNRLFGSFYNSIFDNKEDMFSTFLPDYSLPTNMDCAVWNDIINKISTIDILYITNVRYLVERCARGEENMIDRSQEIFAMHIDEINIACCAFYDSNKTELDMMSGYDRSQAIYNGVIGAIMQEYLSKNGWLEQYFMRQRLSGYWSSIEESYCFCEKWGLTVDRFDASKGRAVFVQRFPDRSTGEQLLIGIQSTVGHYDAYDLQKEVSSSCKV